MSQEKRYWTSMLKKIGYIVFTVLVIILLLKLALFYMPFLIAFIVSLIMEPAIKWIMNNLKLSRRCSSIIVFIIIFGSMVGLLIWGITTIVSEATELLSGFNGYYEKASNELQFLINKFKFEKIKLSGEMANMLQNTAFSILQKISVYIQNILTNLLKMFSSIPIIVIYFIVFILALYFICTDKIYMIDELEHHLPEKWVKKIGVHTREISSALGGYLKAEILLILISFVISLIGLYILSFLGFNVGFPLLIALGIGFVDALPILGSGAVMVPWAVISALNGDLKLGIAIVILWIIMSIVRQILEPKIVSRKYRNTSNIYNNSNVYRF